MLRKAEITVVPGRGSVKVNGHEIEPITGIELTANVGEIPRLIVCMPQINPSKIDFEGEIKIQLDLRPVMRLFRACGMTNAEIDRVRAAFDHAQETAQRAIDEAGRRLETQDEG